MAIRINSNIASLNAQRNLGITNSNLNKTLERLSSGLRINRAADDAAGMAISEKMRTQIRGFTQAIANAQDAGNLIATAESGLDQTTQILQRIRELSLQAANDTLVNADRKKIQVEIDQLLQELDKIAETTEFNTRPLLDGSLQQTAAGEDAQLVIKSNSRIGAFNPLTGDRVADMLDVKTGPNFDVTAFGRDAAFVFTVLAGGNTESGANFVFTERGGGADGNTVAMGAGGYVLEIRSTLQGATANGDVVDMVRYIALTASTVTASAPGVSVLVDLVTEFTIPTSQINFGPGTQFTSQLLIGFNFGNYTTNTSQLAGVTAAPVRLTQADVGKTAVVQFTPRRDAVSEDRSLTMQIGANEGQYLKMGIQDMRARALRLEGLNIVGDSDAESRARAQNAIGIVDAALDYVNANRARLGAIQNRVEYRLNNLEIARENLTASESRIRDADFAAETANLTRAQILVQAGTAVLTQANLSSQIALSLLGG